MNQFNFRQAFVVSAMLALAFAFAGQASAHHSVQAQFDIHKTFTVSGTVAKVEWINPHSYLNVNVTDADGKVQKWAFELGSGRALRRAGMSKEDRGGLKPGDEVTASGLAAGRWFDYWVSAGIGNLRMAGCSSSPRIPTATERGKELHHDSSHSSWQELRCSCSAEFSPSRGFCAGERRTAHGP